jgi:hypothetical protein
MERGDDGSWSGVGAEQPLESCIISSDKTGADDGSSRVVAAILVGAQPRPDYHGNRVHVLYLLLFEHGDEIWIWVTHI